MKARAKREKDGFGFDPYGQAAVLFLFSHSLSMSSLHRHTGLQSDLFPGPVLRQPVRWCWCWSRPRHPVGPTFHSLLLYLLVSTHVQSLQVCTSVLVKTFWVVFLLGFCSVQSHKLHWVVSYCAVTLVIILFPLLGVTALSTSLLSSSFSLPKWSSLSSCPSASLDGGSGKVPKQISLC